MNLNVQNINLSSITLTSNPQKVILTYHTRCSGRTAWQMRITETAFDCKHKQIATFVTFIPLLRVYRATVDFLLAIHS